ncbi:CopG family transcriptional regulator [Amycolatopsis sp. 195334CR]|uniref:ribbon-helix-helix domain-containing protein n=1 Tax=Amycolatopsis sp. 195334CR TaxID=2814588 RepID=UPI001A8EEAA1|nr:CopG family transcriptional regulator [Amycolatopsis sp. 195334CR]MBN6035242.1 hypothetical protein [Amycolatopsis sp. 195334CR]
MEQQPPQGGPASADDYTKLSVYLNPEAAAALKEYTSKRNISYTEAIRRAIAILKFVDEELAAGHELQVNDGESVQKILLVG